MQAQILDFGLYIYMKYMKYVKCFGLYVQFVYEMFWSVCTL